MDWLFQIEDIKAEIPLAWLRLLVISHPSDQDQEAVLDQKGHVTSCPAAAPLLHRCLASTLGYTLQPRGKISQAAHAVLLPIIQLFHFEIQDL